MFLIIVLTVVCLFAIWIKFYFRNAFKYWESRGVPCLEPEFFFGNVKGIDTSINIAHLLQNCYNQLKDKSPLVGFYVYSTPVAVVTSLDLAKIILVKDFNQLPDRLPAQVATKRPLNEHILFLTGSRWKALRQKFTPIFSSSKMKFMFSTVKTVSTQFTESLNELIGNEGEIDMKELVCRYTTDVVGECAFGIECNSLKDPNAEFRVMGRQAINVPKHFVLLQYLAVRLNWLFKYLRPLFIRSEVMDFFLRTVQETVEYREKNGINRNDLIDILIKLKNDKTQGEISLNVIASQVFLFFLAGFETSSTTMAFALYELALQPDLQEKLRDEINKKYRECDDNELTYEAMCDLPYLDQIIKETLRMYPPAQHIARITVSEYHVPGTNIVLEKGQRVYIPNYSMQRDPDIYPNPDKFDPDRFHPDEVAKRHPMSFLSFGEGPRSCIGERFGMMQTRLGLIAILKYFRVEPTARTPIPVKISPTGFVLMMQGELYLRLTKI